MPWTIRQNDGDCPASKPWGVRKRDDGSLVNCHETRMSAAAQIGAMEASEREGSKQSDEQEAVLAVLDDPAFWAEIEDAVLGTILPTWEAIAEDGVEAGRRELRSLGIDPGELPSGFEEQLRLLVGNMAREWYQRIQEGSRQAARSVVERDEELLGRALMNKLRGEVFGGPRAQRIAITETARLMGLGAQSAYQAAGVSEWRWRTQEDDRVDEICNGLDRTVHPVSEPFSPAHVGCRCFPEPIERELETAA
ncbi:MAG: phage minor head protein [Myxococcota bacterium]